MKRSDAATSALAAAFLVLAACADSQSTVPERAAAASLLARPAPPDPGFSGTAPFRLTQNTIQLPTWLNGRSKAGTFILDSGAATTIAPRLAHQLHLEAHGTVELAGPEGGRAPAPLTHIATVTVGGLPFRDVGAVIAWAAPPNQLACLSRDGLLGANLLQAAIWQIDFQTRQITVTDDLRTLPGLDEAVRIPFRRSDTAGSPRIDVAINDIEHVSLLVDLGFNGSLAIPSALLERCGQRIANDAPTEFGRASATVLGGPAATVQIGRLDLLRIGALSLPEFPFITGGSVSDFHVGVEFLRHFRVTLDWQDDALYLQRRDPVDALYPPFATYGFTPQLRDGALHVGAMWRDGAAQHAGLALDERIVAIDDERTDPADFAAFCRILDAVGLYGWKDDPIAVTVRRNNRTESVHVPRAPLRF